MDLCYVSSLELGGCRARFGAARPAIVVPRRTYRGATLVRLSAQRGGIAPPGGGGIGRGGRGGGGDRYGDSGSESESDRLMKFCSQNNVSTDMVDSDVMKAFESGTIGSKAVINYLKSQMNPLKRLFLRLLPWSLSRVLGDELFMFKVFVEESLGIFGKLSAELEQRRSRFMRELDFVVCNLITAILVDFALVYLPAPSVSLQGQGKESWFSRLNRSLPSNIFLTSRPYTAQQRLLGFGWTAAKLFTVGFMCCFTSALLTNIIIWGRQRLDPNAKSENSMQNPFATGAAYATFLGVSSSTRYQIINGVEQHILPALLSSAPTIFTEAATLLLRFGNTFWGSQQWVIFANLTGVQKSGK